MRKKTSDKPTELNQKNFLKLMEKREEIQKEITKQNRKLEKLNTELKGYADWLSKLTQS